MEKILKTCAAMKAAEVITTGEMIGNVLNQASSRAKDVADFLEEVDKFIPDEEEENA